MVMNNLKSEVGNVVQLDLFDTLNSTRNVTPAISTKINFILYEYKKNHIHIKDDLYNRFNNAAMSIYDHVDKSSVDLASDAIKLYPFLGFNKISQVNNPLLYNPVDQSYLIKPSACKTLGLDLDKYSCVIKFKLKIFDDIEHYLIVTDDCDRVEQTGNIFHCRQNASLNFTFINKEHLIGYSRLISNIIKVYINTKEKPLEHSLAQLIIGLVSGKDTISYCNYQKTFEMYSENQTFDEKMADIHHLMNILRNNVLTKQCMFDNSNVYQFMARCL